MKTRILSGLLLLAITFVPATHAWAGDVLNRINETQTLRVGMTGSQPPFNFQSKSGELMGIRVLDHVVFGDGRYVSFKDRGLL